MTGKAQIQQLIAPAEAMELFRYAGVQEMRIAKDLHDLYRAQKGRHSDSLWGYDEPVIFHLRHRESTGYERRKSQAKGALQWVKLSTSESSETSRNRL